eukprot:COSAG04_NODE_1680_length_5962_cov_2.562170_5_plen_422_part_01
MHTPCVGSRMHATVAPPCDLLRCVLGPRARVEATNTVGAKVTAARLPKTWRMWLGTRWPCVSGSAIHATVSIPRGKSGLGVGCPVRWQATIPGAAKMIWLRVSESWSSHRRHRPDVLLICSRHEFCGGGCRVIRLCSFPTDWHGRLPPFLLLLGCCGSRLLGRSVVCLRAFPVAVVLYSLHMAPFELKFFEQLTDRHVFETVDGVIAFVNKTLCVLLCARKFELSLVALPLVTDADLLGQVFLDARNNQIPGLFDLVDHANLWPLCLVDPDCAAICPSAGLRMCPLEWLLLFDLPPREESVAGGQRLFNGGGLGNRRGWRGLNPLSSRQRLGSSSPPFAPACCSLALQFTLSAQHRTFGRLRTLLRRKLLVLQFAHVACCSVRLQEALPVMVTVVRQQLFVQIQRSRRNKENVRFSAAPHLH